VREPSAPSAKALGDLPKAPNSRLLFAKIDSTIASDPASAAAALQKDHGITSLDVLIANVGISHSNSSSAEISLESSLEHFTVNSVAPLLLLNAFVPLLKAETPRKNEPIFVALSTFAAIIEGQETLTKMFAGTIGPYGASKAALNWFMRRLHYEETWLTSFAIHPGLVETDMSASMLSGLGVDVKTAGGITVNDSVDAMMAVIDSATRATSGLFKSYDGTSLPW
jgi:norsolorinic acid ketoreductase